MKIGSLSLGRLSKPQFVESLIEALAESPAGEKIVSEHHAKLIAERKGQVAQLAEVEATFTKSRPAAEKRIVDAEAAIKKILDALKPAEQEFTKAMEARTTLMDTYQRTRAELEAPLRATADPRIDELIDWLREQKTTAADLGRAWELNTKDWTRMNWQVTGNSERVNEYVRLLDNIADEAALLKISFTDDLEASLDGIRARVATAAAAVIQPPENVRGQR